MRWDLPISVEIDGKQYPIRNRCDYRVVLDAICALKDKNLSDDEKIQCALFIFYENLEGCKNIEKAIIEMNKIISYDEDDDSKEGDAPCLMDWEYDFPQIAPPISRILGYDVRTPDKYCHFWTFLGAYMEIGDCLFQNIVSIRSKRKKGVKLEKYEQEFYINNRKLVDLPMDLTDEEQEWLNDE